MAERTLPHPPCHGELAWHACGKQQQRSHTEELPQVVGNTAILAVATATLTVAVCFLVGWITVRTRFAAKRLLDQLAFVSHGVPGVIMALA